MSIEATQFIVEEVDHQIANEYIELGWTLINHYVIDFSEDNRLNQKIRYVLAWQRPDVEPTHPEDSFYKKYLNIVEEAVDDMQKEDYESLNSPR